MAAVKKAARKRSTAARKRIPRSKEARGPASAEAGLGLDDPALAGLVDVVGSAGGLALGGYRDPLSGTPLLLASVPVAAIEPTPFQRDLSPTHVKRLAEKIVEAGVFLDPLVAVVAKDGTLSTPNGRHRLAAARSLGLRSITVLASADPRLAYRILALNTEKAHNLKDRSLEVIRMARALAVEAPRAKESDYAAELESPVFVTLGFLYERNGRFSGGAYQSMLRKVDRFEETKALPASLRAREGLASRLEAIDVEVARLVKELAKRGFKSPYLKPLVVARLNPVRWTKPVKPGAPPPMSLGEALTRMARAAATFDPGSVKPSDLALVAAVADD